MLRPVELDRSSKRTGTRHGALPVRGAEDGDGKELLLESDDDDWPFHMFVVRRGDVVRGYVNTCPHQHLPLSDFPDRFTSPDGGFIPCANHGALFDFEDGVCVAGPCVGQRLETVPLAVLDGIVRIA